VTVSPAQQHTPWLLPMVVPDFCTEADEARLHARDRAIVRKLTPVLTRNARARAQAARAARDCVIR
jgi:hypothetical protein